MPLFLRLCTAQSSLNGNSNVVDFTFTDGGTKTLSLAMQSALKFALVCATQQVHNTECVARPCTLAFGHIRLVKWHRYGMTRICGLQLDLAHTRKISSSGVGWVWAGSHIFQHWIDVSNNAIFRTNEHAAFYKRKCGVVCELTLS